MGGNGAARSPLSFQCLLLCSKKDIDPKCRRRKKHRKDVANTSPKRRQGVAETSPKLRSDVTETPLVVVAVAVVMLAAMWDLKNPMFEALRVQDLSW